ncbi:MAG: YggS family pyridoxal phosphate-dependent enzyme [Candidatus Micrarchaeota archaeon]
MDSGLRARIEEVRVRIARASGRFGIDPSAIILVAATKSVPPEIVNEAIDAGISHIGENIIQDAREKFPKLKKVRKHMIGHLQSNKARDAVVLFDMIQTVDSIKLARKISDQFVPKDKWSIFREGEKLDEAKKQNKIMPILVEVKTDNTKPYGIPPNEVENFLNEMRVFEGVEAQGLMTVGPLFANPEDSRGVFKKMKKLFDEMADADIPNVEMKYLSMGMSADYWIAVEEGANIVRVGTAIFGPRKG